MAWSSYWWAEDTYLTQRRFICAFGKLKRTMVCIDIGGNAADKRGWSSLWFRVWSWQIYDCVTWKCSAAAFQKDREWKEIFDSALFKRTDNKMPWYANMPKAPILTLVLRWPIYFTLQKHHHKTNRENTVFCESLAGNTASRVRKWKAYVRFTIDLGRFLFAAVAGLGLVPGTCITVITGPGMAGY